MKSLYWHVINSNCQCKSKTFTSFFKSYQDIHLVEHYKIMNKENWQELTHNSKSSQWISSLFFPSYFRTF